MGTFLGEVSLSGEDLSMFGQGDLLSWKDSSRHLALRKQGRLDQSQGIMESHCTDNKKRTWWQFTPEKQLLHGSMHFNLVFEK